ncbi:uncharacterized protein BN797_01400 [Eubacterium sp. CAG:841]|nr:uncharacterized protein BN797_01400 [Eubacterium sp. CAG:841]
MFDPREPYNDLPLVSSIYLELTPELNNLREEARVSIELLNYALKSLPNSEILLDTLALQEAKVSSNIENIRTTNDDLLRAVAFKDFNAETKAISDYVTCKFGACAVDGGHDYLRRSFRDKDCYIDLSVTEAVSDKDEK